MSNTKIQRLIEALTNGEELTAKQIAARFRISNPTAAISDIRLDHGYAVYTRRNVDTKGRVTTKYHLGVPSRSVVAAGYRALVGTGESVY